MPKPRWYVGIRATTNERQAFRSSTTPTPETHCGMFAAVVGPFLTRRGARFMALYGANNPHCRTVDEAERLAKCYALPSGRMREV